MTHAEIYARVTEVLTKVRAKPTKRRVGPELQLFSYALTQLRDASSKKPCGEPVSTAEQQTVVDITAFIEQRLEDV